MLQIVDNPKGLLEIIGDSEADALTAREMVIGVVTEPEPGKIYRHDLPLPSPSPAPPT